MPRWRVRARRVSTRIRPSGAAPWPGSGRHGACSARWTWSAGAASATSTRTACAGWPPTRHGWNSLTRRDAPYATEALLDLLRLDGAYAALRERAERKQRALAGLAEPVLDPVEVAGLISWRASSRNEPVPVDLDAYARSLAFADAADLARSLWREREWRHRRPGEGESEDTVGGTDLA